MCICVGRPLSARRRFFCACNMLDMLWCVAKGFVIFVVFRRGHQITPRDKCLLMCYNSLDGFWFGKWGGIRNCDVVVIGGIFRGGRFVSYSPTHRNGSDLSREGIFNNCLHFLDEGSSVSLSDAYSP